MTRRGFLGLGATVVGCSLGQQSDAIVAGATRDTTPRVGIVLSSFRGGADHDGTPFPPLADPCPVTARLTPRQTHALVAAAMDLGVAAQGPMTTLFDEDDWVVLRSGAANLEAVGGAARYLARNRCGSRLTLAPDRARVAPCRRLADDLGRQFAPLRVEVADLSAEPAMDVQVPARSAYRRQSNGIYRIAKTIQHCDKLVALGPLQADERLGFAGTLAGYLDIVPAGAPENSAAETIMDLYAVHPADYAILVGHDYNVALASPSAVAVDAVGAALLGRKASAIPHLQLAAKCGYGTIDIDAIWTRGNEIEEARRPAG